MTRKTRKLATMPVATPNKESTAWIRTIEEGKGYAAITAHAYQKLLRQTHRWQNYRVLHRYTKPGQLVLEAGCGWAFASFALARRGTLVTAVDISEKLVSHLQRLQKELGEPYITNLHIIVADVFRLSELQQEFNVVFSDGVYEHFLQEEDRRNMLKNIHGILKKDGIFLVDVPNMHNIFLHSLWLRECRTCIRLRC